MTTLKILGQDPIVEAETTTTTNATTTQYHYFKAVTPEVAVNTKTRFDKNNIEWVEDITYRNTGNHAYFLKIPIAQTTKPSGCKRMYFIKHYPGPEEEFIADADAAMFYTMLYPRYAHIAQKITKDNTSLIPWNSLTEVSKQHFTRIWGKIILSNIYTITKWKLATNNQRRAQELHPRPLIGTTEQEKLEQFMRVDPDGDTPSRATITISCDRNDIQAIASALAFESPTIYTLDENNNVQ